MFNLWVNEIPSQYNDFFLGLSKYINSFAWQINLFDICIRF